MPGSLHNFFFVSSDPGGLVSLDKPPLGLWLQTVSAAIFGFHPLSLLVPEALCAVAAVAVLYWIVAPRFGVWAGVPPGAARNRHGRLGVAGRHRGARRPGVQHQDAGRGPRRARTGRRLARL